MFSSWVSSNSWATLVLKKRCATSTHGAWIPREYMAWPYHCATESSRPYEEFIGRVWTSHTVNKNQRDRLWRLLLCIYERNVWQRDPALETTRKPWRNTSKWRTCATYWKKPKNKKAFTNSRSQNIQCKKWLKLSFKHLFVSDLNSIPRIRTSWQWVYADHFPLICTNRFLPLSQVTWEAIVSILLSQDPTIRNP